jgi:hypothetical protein
VRLVRSPPNGAESLFCCRSRQHVADTARRRDPRGGRRRIDFRSLGDSAADHGVRPQILSEERAVGTRRAHHARTRGAPPRRCRIIEPGDRREAQPIIASQQHPEAQSCARHTHPSAVVVFQDKISWPNRALTSVGRLAHPCGRGRETRRKVPANEAVLRRSSLGVAVPYSASHAGGRGFESRRSRHKAPANALSCCLNRQRPRAHATHTRVRGDPKRAKTARKRVRGSSSSRFRRALRPTARGSRRSHRMAGGQAIKETLPRVSRRRT